VISVDRKVAEVAGHLHIEAPKNRKRRQTIYPRLTPSGHPLAERLAARSEQVRTEQHFGSNPLGLLFPSPHGRLWRSSNGWPIRFFCAEFRSCTRYPSYPHAAPPSSGSWPSTSPAHEGEERSGR